MYSLRVSLSWALSALAILTCTTIASAQSFEIKRYDGIYGSNAISRGDFNGDGILDVIIGQGDSFLISFGNPDGTLRAGTRTTVSSQINDIAVADFNNDGKLDVAVVGITAATAYVFLGHGDGTFNAPIAVGLKSDALSVTAADVNNDGKVDLIVADGDSSGERVEILENQGNGTFNKIGEYAYNDSSNFPTKVRAGDFNQDGKVDIAVQLFHSMNVLWGAGDGTFHAQQLGTYVETNDMNTGDLNQDGRTDIIVSYYDQSGGAPGQWQRFGTQKDVMIGPLNGGVDAYFGTSSQQMTRKNVVGSQYESPDALWAVDVDGDGIADIVALNNNENWHDGLYIWFGHPDGTYDQSPHIFAYTTDRDKEGMVPGDFNRDGRVDFVALRVGTGSIETLLNATPRSTCRPRTDTESITVCQPTDYTFSNSPLHDVAKATGSNITAMQVYIDNKLVKTNSGSSMDAYFSLAPGDHFIVNKAWNSVGQSFRSDRHVRIFAGGAGQTCGTNYGGATDTINMCLPQNNMVDKGAIRVFANAYTETVQTAMQVYIDNQLKLNDSTSSFVDQTYSEAPGQHYVVVKAWDADGHNVSKSAIVTVQ
jgi:hypothetical protein